MNRRQFLRKSIAAALGGAGLYSAFGNLRLVEAAANQIQFTDYKALVCVFLYGGNDSFNTIVPYDTSHYGYYADSRRSLALARATIQANSLSPLAVQAGLPGGPPSDGGQYGLHPALSGLRGLFNSGKVAIVGNVGSLLYPTTVAQYQNESVPTPPQLFSHDDQTTQWQTSRPDDTSAVGWGGRIADLLHASNAGQLPMSISLADENRFQRGTVVDQYSMSPDGVTKLSYQGDGPESWVMDGDNASGAAAYRALIAAGTQGHVLERSFANAAGRSIANYERVDSALLGAPALATVFPDTDLGNQLKMVARLISIRGALGMSRQVFFTSVGGYDTHGTQIADQQDNLSQLSQALVAFNAALTELGIGNGVTTFTASDFGRTLPINSDGTDHGWGGHHFVMGDAVRGGRFYGSMPSLIQNTDAQPDANPDDTGYGQIIPTTAVDQYSATLASWFGVNAGGIADIFPNLGRFASPNLRFLG
ncbi:MAG: DUF1501 domain-containing protein [Tahibacter sp.]